MVRAHSNIKFYFSAVPVLLLLFNGHLFAQQDDPPSRVARLNYLNGNVSMEPAGVDEWAPADLNRPFTIGDYLYTDQGAEAELHLDIAVMRMGSQTSFGFLNLDDRTVQLKLTEGDMYIRVHNFSADQVFEVDTPNAAVTLLNDGVYRFRVDANGNSSFVVVRQGRAQITGGGQAFLLNSGNSASLSGTDQLAYDIEAAPAPDEFDQWCQARDAHEAQLASARYVPPTVIGYEDLDDYGSWQNNSDYGEVWYPQNVDVGWAPYHDGHWAWIHPWGWTWVDSMPWGFAPFHYGRWAYIGNRWGWCPGPVGVGYGGPVVRPYYAPALVAWFGGAHFGVGISLGGGPSLGWVPLGFGEVYTPSYHCSPRYFNNVNVYNTRIVKTVNITNVYNNVYINKQVYNQQYINSRAPNAVMAMPQSAFATGRSVRQAANPVRQADFARMRTASVVAPPVAPGRQALIPTAGTRPAPHPAAQVMQRQVVARIRPPAAPAPFSAGQNYLQQHAGQPVNFQAMHQAVPAARPVAVNVREAPAARAVQVKPGQRVGNAAAFNRPAPAAPLAARPGQPAAQVRPTEPTQQVRPTEPAQGQPRRPPVEPRSGQPAAQARPAQPGAPAGHGVPPNMRQQNSQPAESGRFAERTPQPGVSPGRNQPAAQPRVQERTQPAPVEPRNEVRTPTPEPRTPERNAPAPRSPQRQEPTPRTPPARTAPEERPAARPESRPAPAAHGTPPPHEDRSAPPSHDNHPKDDHKDHN